MSSFNQCNQSSNDEWKNIHTDTTSSNLGYKIGGQYSFLIFISVTSYNVLTFPYRHHMENLPRPSQRLLDFEYLCELGCILIISDPEYDGILPLYPLLMV